MTDETQEQLQKFADANGITIDIEKFLQTLPAGQYLVLTTAMEHNDNQQIIDIMNNYGAQQFESYNNFKLGIVFNNDLMETVSNMTYTNLSDFIAESRFKVFDVSKYSLNSLRTLVYEDLQSSAHSSLNGNGSTQSDETSNQDITKTGNSNNVASISDMTPQQINDFKMKTLQDKISSGQNVTTSDQSNVVSIQDNDPNTTGISNADGSDNQIAVLQKPDGTYDVESGDDLAKDSDMSWLDDMINAMKRDQ